MSSSMPSVSLSNKRNAPIVLTVLVLALALSGCAIFRPTGRPSDALAALRYDIDQVLADSMFIPSRASIKVISGDTKEMLYERDSKLLMRPASNVKLLTSATALHVLGKEYRFKTSISSDTIPVNGVIEGNLYIKGFANPDLRTADLDTLVARIHKAGIERVTGGVVADVSFFDDQYWGAGWQWDDEPTSDAPFLTPLSINDNCIVVTVSPGAAAGDSVRVTLEPPTSYVTVINKGTTIADTVRRPLSITRLFRQRLNTILVEGEFPQNGTPIEEKISVWRPELYTAELLKEALQRRGIVVGPGLEVGQVPAQNHEIAAHYQRIDSSIVNLNKISDNLTAEMLLKTLDAVMHHSPGSSRGGLTIINQFLSTFGIDTTSYRIVDGSGLSFYNLVTAEILVKLLYGMQHQTDIFPLFYESLPIAGVDGSLRNRMKKTPAEANLRAKTGTISGVSSLSGYVQSLDGERLIFSMMMQNFASSARSYQSAQDKIGALLAGFSRSGLKAQPTH